ncbi:MAG TPA: alpha-galactosidase, partial [Bryobacteraceae bacterium]|nr:alpha-galactosidase [Bryobacteraceae bacterium]
MRLAAILMLGLCAQAASPFFKTRLARIEVTGSGNCLWELQRMGAPEHHCYGAPAISIDDRLVSMALQGVRQSSAPVKAANGSTEYAFEGEPIHLPGARLALRLQVAEDNAVVRFRYGISAPGHKLTNAGGAESLTYTTISLAHMPAVKEVRLSEFLELTHSYSPSERELDAQAFLDSSHVMGPLLVGGNATENILLAYEHGSQAPDAFLQYDLRPDRSVAMRAVKGNYLAGQMADRFETVWLDTAVVAGGFDRLASEFRSFVLRRMTANAGTRRPLIAYNTWNFQERNRWWNGKPYLDSMNNDRMLKEIDVAHRLGIEVFVMDTGWYEKTGEWQVSRKRFPDGLRAISDRLRGYGMRLGLWFGPTSAAVSTSVASQHPEWRISWDGKARAPREVWETETSFDMCLVSPYSDFFANELIRAAKDTGVTYFKWDAVDQYACNDAHHWHGTEANSPRERSESYAFQIAGQLARIADRVGFAVPDSIVDFDVTEGGRAFGLQFLSAGRYFVINNGPYYMNYNIPFDQNNSNWNVFFYKGTARTWIARAPLSFDRWIPSTLLLTHYFPDDPIASQEVNIASLILGQNGIWGDLLQVSDAGVNYIARELRRYKQV